jgi:3-hydroxyacyl-CoA dehydrogenase
VKPALVALVGVGTIGASWATAFIRAGCEVRLWDADPASVQGRFESGALGGAIACETLQEALSGADWIQESTTEDMALKARLLAVIDTLAAPEAVIASSTSAIMPSVLFEHLVGRSRCLVVHPVNPPHAVPLVEVCPSQWTDEAVVCRAMSAMRSIGSSPVRIAREMDGFALNRMQFALLGEALRLVEDGVCTPDDIDRVVSDGLGRRWALAGPFIVAHFGAGGGFAEFFRHLGPTIERLQRSFDTGRVIKRDTIERITAYCEEQVPPPLAAARARRQEDLCALGAWLETHPREEAA